MKVDTNLTPRPPRHHSRLLRHLRPRPPQQQTHRGLLRRLRRVPRLPPGFFPRRPSLSQNRRCTPSRRRESPRHILKIHRDPRLSTKFRALENAA